MNSGRGSNTSVDDPTTSHPDRPFTNHPAPIAASIADVPLTHTFGLGILSGFCVCVIRGKAATDSAAICVRADAPCSAARGPTMARKKAA